MAALKRSTIDAGTGPRAQVAEYVESLRGSRTLGRQVVHYHVQPPSEPVFAEPDPPLSPSLGRLLEELGIGSLYSHQAEAISLIRNGRSVVAATPTSSGKSLIYNIPMAERFLEDPGSRSLYLFPLKALAQDQLRGLERLSGALSRGLGRSGPTAAIYDGDTSAWRRGRIRANPPNCLLTNPEMLHLSLLPYHDKWSEFWHNLSMVVIDEVHTYRGILGSNMAWVFRRLARMCRYYGSDPVFILCSATIGNPGALAEALIGRQVHEITASGAPRARRHLLLMEPDEAGAPATAVQLLLAGIHRGLRTIVYTQSRKLTELVSLWAAQRAGRLADKISSYRAGYLPEERRAIEAALASGETLAVISTSALELGIDIGELDLCILVGYPGTLMSLRQRSGRVGRSMRESAVIMVAGEDALDRYFLTHPEELVTRPAEKAVLNPANKIVAGRHLVCAASEMPIKRQELLAYGHEIEKVAEALVAKGRLFEMEVTSDLVSLRRYPQREVDLRGAGKGFQILDESSGRQIGSIDGIRVFKETHPGAVYLHRGTTYVITGVDQEARRVFASKKRVNYYTRVRSSKETEILEVKGVMEAGGIRVFTGALRVTETITGYDMRLVRGQRLISRVSLDLPPLIFETTGFWFQIPESVRRLMERQRLHFMGGIHAVEHAVIGIMPLVVLCDRNDLGGISITFHPQVGGAAIFVYDGIPGGAGLSGQAFSHFEGILELTFETVGSCSCELGCPSCVHSPKCGSGNRPIDKEAALRVLEELINGLGARAGGACFRKVSSKGLQSSAKKRPDDRPELGRDSGFQALETGRAIQKRQIQAGSLARSPGQGSFRFGVFDVETQLSAQEVGGWHRAERMRISCAVLYDSATGTYSIFREDQLERFFRLLSKMDLVVGFNVKRFDYKVLSPYTSMDLWSLPTLDILESVRSRLGYRLSLDSLSRATLGAEKSASGLDALKWWRQGRLDKVKAYCKEDVRLTKELYLFGLRQGYLLFRNKAKALVRLPVDWSSETP